MLTTQDMNTLKGTFVTHVEHEDAFSFIVENMATKEDLRNLEDKFDRKFYGFESKFDKKFEDLEGKFDQVMVTLDGIAGAVQDMRLESSVSVAQYARQVEWNHRVAEKIDVPFEY